jgi:hypothetical protein
MVNTWPKELSSCTKIIHFIGAHFEPFFFGRSPVFTLIKPMPNRDHVEQSGQSVDPSNPKGSIIFLRMNPLARVVPNVILGLLESDFIES